MSVVSTDSCLCKTPNCTSVHSSDDSYSDGYIGQLRKVKTKRKRRKNKSVYTQDLLWKSPFSSEGDYMIYCEDCDTLSCHGYKEKTQTEHLSGETTSVSDIHRKLALYHSNLINFVIPKYSDEIQAVEKHQQKYRSQSKSIRRKLHTQCAELHSQVNQIQSKILKDLDQTESKHLNELEQKRNNLISRKIHLEQLNLECKQKIMSCDLDLVNFYKTQCSEVSLILPSEKALPFIPEFKAGIMDMSLTENQIGQLILGDQTMLMLRETEPNKSIRQMVYTKYRKHKLQQGGQRQALVPRPSHLNLEQNLSLVTLSD